LRDFDFVEDFLVFTIALLLQKEPASLWKVDAFTGLQGSGAKDMRTNERDAFIAVRTPKSIVVATESAAD